MRNRVKQILREHLLEEGVNEVDELMVLADRIHETTIDFVAEEGRKRFLSYLRANEDLDTADAFKYVMETFGKKGLNIEKMYFDREDVGSDYKIISEFVENYVIEELRVKYLLDESEGSKGEYSGSYGYIAVTYPPKKSDIVLRMVLGFITKVGRSINENILKDVEKEMDINYKGFVDLLERSGSDSVKKLATGDFDHSLISKDKYKSNLVAILDEEGQKIMKSVLLHELQHAYDGYRSNHKDKFIEPEKARKVQKRQLGLITPNFNELYLTLPHEIWARFSQAIQKMKNEGLFEKHRDDFGFIKEAFEQKYMYGYDKIKDKTKKRLLKALYKYWSGFQETTDEK